MWVLTVSVENWVMLQLFPCLLHTPETLHILSSALDAAVSWCGAAWASHITRPTPTVPGSLLGYTPSCLKEQVVSGIELGSVSCAFFSFSFIKDWLIKESTPQLLQTSFQSTHSSWDVSCVQQWHALTWYDMRLNPLPPPHSSHQLILMTVLKTETPEREVPYSARFSGRICACDSASTASDTS